MSGLPPEPPPEDPQDDDDADDGEGGVDDNVILLPSFGGFGLRTVGPDEHFPDGPAEGLEEPAGAPGELAPPSGHLMEGAVEALLLAADGPVMEHELDRWLGLPGLAAVRDALQGIQDRLRRGYGGIRLVQVAKGWQLRTDVRFAPWVAAMRGGRPVKLSRAALETLTIVAYRQPVTRTEVEDLRGCDSGGVLRMLCERGLVAVTGRKDAPGRPLLYGTTPEFLAMFSLRDLSDLPTLRDLRELRQDDPREAPGSGTDDDEMEGSGLTLLAAGQGPLDEGDDDWSDGEEEPPAAPPRRGRQTSLLPPDPDDLPEDFDDEA